MSQPFQVIRKAAKEVGQWYFSRLFASSRLQMLFICGHMRSGSSLLVHVLNSNPAIVGYGETHHRYTGPSDFGKPALSVYWSFKRFPAEERYVLDKVVHTQLLEDPLVLEDARTIFLIRRPGAALSSLLDFRPGEVVPGEKVETPQEAFDYYVERLAWISNASEAIAPRLWTFLTYQDLVSRTDHAFRRLQNVLSLETPLTREYEKTWATGRTWIGDPSEKIKTGRIVEPKKKEIAEEVEPFLEKAEEAFGACLAKLEEQKNSAAV